MTRRMLNLALAAALALTAGCQPTGPDAGLIEELRDNRRLWEQQGLTDYSYVLQHGCFCGSEVTDPVRITVEDGVRTSAVYVASGEPVSASFQQHFPTIDGLFDQLEDMFDRADEAEATYHRTFGYPLEVQIDFVERGIDDELSLSVIELVPIRDPL